MKKLRIICLVLAALLVLPMVASCGGNKVVSNVTIKFQVPKDDTDPKDPEYDILFELEFPVEGTTSNKPNVLQAAEEALTKYEKDYELSKDGTYIAAAFDRAESDSADSENGYFNFWDVSINGKRSTEGRQSVTEIYDGDEIVYTWTSDSRPRMDTEAVVTTDPNNETTASTPDDETTEDPNAGEFD